MKTRWYGVYVKQIRTVCQRIKVEGEEKKNRFCVFDRKRTSTWSVPVTYVRHIRPSQLNSSRRYTYLARCGERSSRWSCSLLSSKISNFVMPTLSCMYMYIGYRSTVWCPLMRDESRWCRAQKNNENTSAISSRLFISPPDCRRSLLFCSTREFNARIQCEDVSYCASRKARFFTPTFFVITATRTTERETGRQGEYRGAPSSLSSFLDHDSIGLKGGQF